MIAVHHLRKEYEGTVALENLHLDVPRGEVYGLIGPNGAGKTTLLRILATLLEPTYGEVRIGGFDVLEQPLEVHRIVGYMSDVFAVYENMLVWEYLDHFARCYGVPTDKRPGMIDEVLHLVSLDVRRDSECRTLSRGMRQRLCLAKTLIHEPQVLLLDEPASGMDPAGRIEFREMLKQLQSMGRTVLISSHILTEMADFCTSVGILEQGRLLASGRVEDILKQLRPGLGLEIEVAAQADGLLAILTSHESIADPEADKNNPLLIRCRWNGERHALPDLHKRIVESGVPVIAFAVKTDNLEDIYMKISGHRTA
jgi:ABC-2 type transport system ATP-binding protein